MRLYRPLASILIFFNLLFAQCKEPINININDLEIDTFIKSVAKITNKNILQSDSIEGKVNFISNKPLCKDELFYILKYILEDKGYKVEENGSITRIIKLNEKTNKPLLSNEVIRLKNIEAKNVHRIISPIIKLKNETTKIKTFASIDNESNSLILIGHKDELKYLKKLILTLDIDKQQVYVQARIIEISETKINNLGVQWGINGYAKGGSGLATFSSKLNGGNNVSTISSNSLGSYGYDISTLKSGISLGATINLLKQNLALDVVSEPSILCINNKESSIYVGETKSIQTASTTSSSGSTTSTYAREDIGLTLKVKPRISNGNKVTLNISTILEDASETKTTNNQPDTTKKEVITTAIVNNGESVILGGLIKNKTESTEDKVPLLGDIPILGNLFKNSFDIKDKINLVVIVTPYIIPKSKDLTYVRNQLAELKILEDKVTKDIELRIKQKNQATKKEKFDAKNIKLDQVRNPINSYLESKKAKDIFGI